MVSSENSLEIISKRYDLKKGELAVVGDGVDLDLFSGVSEKKVNEVREVREWAGEDKLLIYTGGMEDGKGVGALLENFLKQKPEDWKLLMYGNGKQRREYEQWVANKKEEKRIRFAREFGYFSLPSFLKLADCAIEPKELWIVDKAKHNQAFQVARAEYQRRVLDFFDKNLGAAPTSV